MKAFWQHEGQCSGFVAKLDGRNCQITVCRKCRTSTPEVIDLPMALPGDVNVFISYFSLLAPGKVSPILHPLIQLTWQP